MDYLQNVGIYVIHARKGYEFHEKRITKLFGENKLNFEFVTEGDPSLFTDELLNQYFSPDIRNTLGDGTLSCTLNHILAYERMIKNKNSYAIVFENDPFFLGDFQKKLKKIFPAAEALDKGWIISLENSTLKFPSYWTAQKGKYLYQATAGRMAGAYMIDLAGAKTIIKDLKQHKCHTVIDWWHNSLIDRGVVKMYWAHPPLVEQGSHNGHLNSTISSKRKSFSRRLSWVIQKNYKTYVKRLFPEKRIIKG